MAPKTAVPSPPKGAKQTSRPPQVHLAGLLGMMAVAGVVMAPLFYFLRGLEGDSQSRLVGMLMILAGPLLLLVIVSSGLAVYRWFTRQ